MSSALVIVDVQNDFVEGGALAVAGGLEVSRKISEWVRQSGSSYDLIVVSQDYHNPPPDDNDGHFALDSDPNYATTWPVHCVGGSRGAGLTLEVALALAEVAGDVKVEFVRKGQGRNDYSAWNGVTKDGRTLEQTLKGVTAVDVVGLAFDHCVRATAVDIDSTGIYVAVLTNLTAAVSADGAIKTATELFQRGIYLAAGE